MAWGDEPGVVTLPDGRRVRGASWRRDRGGVPTPDLAVHLAGREPAAPPWPREFVRWRDFGLPADRSHALAVLRDAYVSAERRRVEIACGGGIGRTGTALAVLAVFAGEDPRDAVAWVRRAYHPRAVETPWQAAWVRSLDPGLAG